MVEVKTRTTDGTEITRTLVEKRLNDVAFVAGLQSELSAAVGDLTDSIFAVEDGKRFARMVVAHFKPTTPADAVKLFKMVNTREILDVMFKVKTRKRKRVSKA